MATNKIGSRLSALFAKMDELAAPGTDKTLRRVGMLCIRIAMYSILPAGQRQPIVWGRRMERLLDLTTAEFEEEHVLWDVDRSEVSKVRHLGTGRAFVKKELFLAEPVPESEEDFWEEHDALVTLRLLREACLMAACGGHPNLVRFYAVARHPDTDHCYHSLIMEHVGPTLIEVLRKQRGRVFPERDVRTVVRQVLAGTKAMHDRGIVHGAINPENVLVAEEDATRRLAVKIAGFGRATSREGNVLSYRAPELLLSPPSQPPSSPAADSWAIGCLMLELLAGVDVLEVEFDDDVEGQLDVIFRVLCFEDPRLLPGQEGEEEVQSRTERERKRMREQFHPDELSDDGFEVLNGLLARDPSRRLTPAAALQRPWFHTALVVKRPSSWSLVSRQPALLAAFALLLLVIFFGLYVLNVRKRLQ
jgi:cell division cycle 2-like